MLQWVAVVEGGMQAITTIDLSKTQSDLTLHLSIIGNIPEADVSSQPDPVPGRGRGGVGQHAAKGQGWRAQSGACIGPGRYSLSLLQQQPVLQHLISILFQYFMGKRVKTWA